MELSFKELNPVYREQSYDDPGIGKNWSRLLMSYFRELPDILYQSPFKERNSSTEYIVIKNIFRRVKLRDDLKMFSLYLISIK